MSNNYKLGQMIEEGLFVFPKKLEYTFFWDTWYNELQKNVKTYHVHGSPWKISDRNTLAKWMTDAPKACLDVS